MTKGRRGAGGSPRLTPEQVLAIPGLLVELGSKAAVGRHLGVGVTAIDYRLRQLTGTNVTSLKGEIAQQVAAIQAARTAEPTPTAPPPPIQEGGPTAPSADPAGLVQKPDRERFDPRRALEQVARGTMAAFGDAIERAKGAENAKLPLERTKALKDAAWLAAPARDSSQVLDAIQRQDKLMQLREREVAARETHARAAAEGKLGVKVNIAVGIKLDLMEQLLTVVRAELGPSSAFERIAARARQALEAEGPV